MLRISKEQMSAFEAMTLRSFQDEIIEYVKRYFPKQLESLAENDTQKAIQYILKRSKSHGFTTQRNACLYVGIAFMLGSNFDDDPQYPWVEKILFDPCISHPVKRIDQLDTATQFFLDQTEGENDEYFQSALTIFRQELISGFLVSSEHHVGQQILQLFAKSFPQKYVVLGDKSLKILIVQAVHSAQGYGLGKQGAILYSILMFLFGSGCDTDPQFPWVSSVLDNYHDNSPEEKTQRLNEETIAYLTRRLSQNSSD